MSVLTLFVFMYRTLYVYTGTTKLRYGNAALQKYERSSDILRSIDYMIRLNQSSDRPAASTANSAPAAANSAVTSVWRFSSVKRVFSAE